MNHTSLLPKPVRHATELSFLGSASRQYSAQLPRYLLGRWSSRSGSRTPEIVQDNHHRQKSQAQLKDLDSYLYGRSVPDFYLFGNRITFGDPARANRYVLDTLHAEVRRQKQSGAIVEFGSGSGRNLISLRREFDCRLVGFEPSPASVDLAQRASRRFELPVDFFCCDATEDTPAVDDVDVIFTDQALEMMPRVFEEALANMMRYRPRTFIFLEPVEELWPWNLRGLLSRVRVRYLDRLRGLTSAAKKLGEVEVSRALGHSFNPLNEVTLTVVKPYRDR